MKKWSVSAALLLAACVVSAAGLSSSDAREQPCCGGRESWLASALMEVQSVKAGTTRGELLKVFAEQGGLRTRTRERFVYRKCQLIHVDVEFEPVGPNDGPTSDPSPDDKIKNISEPILCWELAD